MLQRSDVINYVSRTVSGRRSRRNRTGPLHSGPRALSFTVSTMPRLLQSFGSQPGYPSPSGGGEILVSPLSNMSMGPAPLFATVTSCWCEAIGKAATLISRVLAFIEVLGQLRARSGPSPRSTPVTCNRKLRRGKLRPGPGHSRSSDISKEISKWSPHFTLWFSSNSRISELIGSAITPIAPLA
jgi:hypothetical protein